MLMPFDLSRRDDSIELLPDSIQLLAVELPSFLNVLRYLRPAQIDSYRTLQWSHHFKPYTFRFVSASGLQWYIP